MKRFDGPKDGCELKEKILDAADARFRTYGFKKTAMSEIADDLGMSTSNLYRYFPSKLDIVEGFALRCFVEKEKALTAMIDLSSKSPKICLKEYGNALLKYNFQQLNEYPMLKEIIMALCEVNSELVDRKREGELSILKDILEKGQEQNCWAIDDLEETGLAIMASWVMFSTPTFMRHQTLEQLEKRLSNLLNLIINGLKVRG